ncbi:MAG: efflux RND transporter periplasmic adaptor subunit [Rikenellaceae bacterium]
MKRVNLGLILFSALILGSCAEQSREAQGARRVNSEVVEALSQETTSTSYPAKLYAAKESNCSFRVAGIIEKIEVREGQRVTNGEVIAKLDPRDYEVQLAATTAEYKAISSEADRVIALYAKESVTENDFDKATNGKRQIEAKLQAHTNALCDTELKAPYSGYIQSIGFERGEAVAAGTPIIKMVSDLSPEVVANIPASEYVRYESLHSAVATIDLFPEAEFRLEPIGITHKANLNQLYEARFRIVGKNTEAAPTAGMSAMVTLRYPVEQKEAVEIAFAAIVERDGESAVWLIEEGRATLRKIEVLKISNRGRARVTGLKSGDEVITAGVKSLKEGQSVRALEQPSESNVGGVL